MTQVAQKKGIAKASAGLTYVKIGPFEDHVAACKYCYSSHSKGTVVPNCICTAFTGGDGPTMFCTATPAGVRWSSEKDGACMCTEKNMAQMGKTTCDPHKI